MTSRQIGHYDDIFKECKTLQDLTERFEAPAGIKRRASSATSDFSDSPMKRSFVVNNESTTEEEEL